MSQANKPRVVECRDGRCKIVAPNDDEVAISVFAAEAELHPTDSVLIPEGSETVLAVPQRRFDNSNVLGHVFGRIGELKKARGVTS